MYYKDFSILAKKVQKPRPSADELITIVSELLLKLVPDDPAQICRIKTDNNTQGY